MLDLFRPKHKSTELRLKIALFVEPDNGGYYAFAPAFKGLHVSGATVDEAKENARNAIVLYIESLIKHGDPLPIGDHLSVEEQEHTPPPSAVRTSVTLEWPSMQMCGIS